MKFNIERASIFEREEYYKLKSKIFFLCSIVLLFTLFFTFGSSLNRIAVIENECKMPVYDFKEFYSFDERDTQMHSFFQSYEKEKINRFYFTDIIYFRGGYWSIGDFVQFFSLPFIAVFFLVMLCFVIKITFFERKLKKRYGGKNI